MNAIGPPLSAKEFQRRLANVIARHEAGVDAGNRFTVFPGGGEPAEGLQYAELVELEELRDRVAELERLRAEVVQLRAYAETTRHHQQQHAETFRALEKTRAELATAKVSPLVDWPELLAEIEKFRPTSSTKLEDARQLVSRFEIRRRGPL